MPCLSLGTIIQGCPALASPESHRRALKWGKALKEGVVSNCSRQEWILPLLHMENIPSWKLSWTPCCCYLMSDSKIPLGFSDNICSQWLDGSPVRFKLIFWMKKCDKMSPCSTCRCCLKGKSPKKQKEEPGLDQVTMWCNYTSVPRWLSPTT